MRLTPREAVAIKESVYAFDPNAKVYLFGSRVRDDLRGGDIDLLVMSKKIFLEEKIKLKLKLYDVLGEQKIDIVIPNESNQVFAEMALEEGVLL